MSKATLSPKDNHPLARTLREALRQTIAWTGCFAIVAQPLMAQTANIVGDGGGQSPTVYSAANGVTVVDIKKPNGAGVSHNTYRDFSVGSGGAILNNSATEISQSQLGGLLQGNANLNGVSPAGVILNEVTSSNRSLLNGAIEVHGNSAAVVVANPNGITCDGCGFINTPRVTLSTGVPKLGADGSLATLRVENGDVLIGPNGASLGTVDIFDIVSRKISVQGPVEAKRQLNLIAGRNELAWQTGLITPLVSDGNEPGIAIDSSLLGGMYAGAIKVISSDRGSGVNMRGQMAANAGQMQITSDGRLVMGKARASGGIVARSKRSAVRANGTLFSEKAVILEGLTRAEIAAGALVASSDDLHLAAGEIALEDGAIVAAGVTSAGTLSAVGSVTVSGNSLSTQTGRIVADTDVTITASHVDIDRGAQGAATVEAGRNVVMQSDTVAAANALVVAGQGIEVSSSGALAVNSGQFSAGTNATLSSSGSLTNSAEVGAKGLVTVAAQSGTLVNSGTLAGDAGLSITAQSGDVSNSGKLLSQKAVTVTASGALSNSAVGQMGAGETLTLTAASLDNQGSALALGTGLTVGTTGAVSNSGTLRSDGALLVQSDGTLTNTGKLLAQGAVQVQGLTGALSGDMVTGAGSEINGTEITLKATSLTNAGDILARAGDAAVSSSGEISSSGRILSTDTIALNVDGDVTVSAGELSAAEEITIKGLSGTHTGAVSLAGDVSAADGLTLAARDLSIGAAGDVAVSDGAISADVTGALTVAGLVRSKGEIALKVDGTSTVSGKLLSDEALLLASRSNGEAGALTVMAGGELNGKTLALNATSITSAGDMKAWGGEAALQSAGRLTNTGTLQALGALNIGADGGVQTSGAIRSNAAITLTARSGGAMQDLDVQAGGAVEAGSTLTAKTGTLTNAGLLGSHNGTSDIESAGAVANSGTLFAKGALDLKTDGVVNNSGQLVADDALALKGLTGIQTGTLTTSVGSELSGSTVSLTSAQVQNGGEISSRTGDTLLSVAGDITSSGKILSAKDVILATDGALTVTAGEIAATDNLTLKGLIGTHAGEVTTAGLVNAGKAAQITAQSLTVTSAGQVAAFDGDLTLALPGTLSNAGKLIGKAAATLTVDGAIENTGDILVEDGLTIKSAAGTASGALTTQSGSQINAGSITAEVASLQNTGSITAHDTDIVLRSAGAINSAGAFEGVQDVTLQTDSTLTNAGRLLAGRDLTVKGLNGAKAGAVTNQSGARLEAGRVLGVDASSLSNAGHLGSHGTGTTPPSLDLDLNTSTANTGTVFAKGDAVLQAASLSNSGKLLVDGAFETDAQTTNLSGAELVAKSIKTTSGVLSNAGSIRSHDGDLVLDARSSFSNTGRIEARGNAALTLGQSLSLTSGKLASTGTLSLTGAGGASFGNLTVGSGYVLNGSGGLTLAVSTLTNNGGVGSSNGAVNVSATGNIVNRGLLYSGTTGHYRLDGSFTNTGADVLAETDLTIEGLSGARAGALLNDQGGIIEAVSGDMVLRVASLTNSRTAPTITQSSNTAVTYEGNPDTTPINGSTAVWSTVTTTTTTDQASLNGTAAKILAGGNLVIDSGATTNSYSQIAAGGNVSISGGNVVNLGQDLIETKQIDKSNRHTYGYCKRFFGIGCRKRYDIWYTNTSETETSTVGAVYGTIEAGLNLSISAPTGYVNNVALRENSGQLGLASGARAMGTSNVSGASGTSGIAQTSVSGASATGGITDPGVAIASLSSALQTFVQSGSPVASLSAGAVTISGVPQGPAGLGLTALVAGTNSILGRSALFDTQLSPNMPFLVETRPDFIDRSKYLGSDYFIKRLGGYDSNKVQKRFGDAYVETRLIRDQIYELTGSRFVGAPDDMRGQMQALYDNAIDESKRLGLTVGTSLSPSQIAALQTDITWLETQTVQGQQVLVPRLYLSQATLASLDLNSGQLRAGGTTTITSAALQNSGSVTGQSGLQITTALGTNNTGGSLFSDADIEINAGSLFDNTSGQVSGSNVKIAATKITVDTLKSTDLFEGGFRDRAQQRARIAATGSLTLEAGTGGLSGTGADLSAGGDLSLTSAGDIELKALALDFSRESETNGGKDTASSRTHTLASLSAGGNLTVRSEQKLTLTGVTGSAGGNASITAAGEVDIASVQDAENRSLTMDFTDKGLFKAKIEVDQTSNSLTLNRSTFSSGGDLLIQSDTKNVKLNAIGLRADGSVGLVAEEGKVQFKASKDALYQRNYLRNEDLFWWSLKDQGVDRTDLQYVSIEAGGGIKISAGQGIEVEYDPKGSATAGIDALAAKPGMSWMQQLQNDPSVDWQEIDTAFKEWDYKQQGLTEAGALLVTAITTFATAGSGGLVSKLSTQLANNLGVTSIAGQAAIKAGVANLINRSAVAVVNNRGNLAKALAEVASEEGMKSLITSMITAGLSAELIQVAGITPLADNATALETFQNKAATGLITNSVNSVVSTAINGGDLGDSLVQGWSTAMVQAGLAGVQHSIGDWKKANGISDGAAADILAHATAGCIAGQVSGSSCADGAAAGALSAILAPSVGGAGWDKDKQIAAQNMFATGALLLAGSGAQSASTGGQIAGSAHENNYLNHQEKLYQIHAEKDVEECKSDSSCTAEELEEFEKTVAYWKKVDSDRDAALTNACSASPTGRACVTLMKDAFEAQGWYNPRAGDLSAVSNYTGPDGYRRLRFMVDRMGEEAAFSGARGEILGELWAEYRETEALIRSNMPAVDAALEDTVIDSAVVAGTALVGGGAFRSGTKAGGQQSGMGNVNSTQLGRSSSAPNTAGGERLLWGSWNDYPKVTRTGPNGPQEYAQIGDRLYSQHAVARMQPSGQRYSSGVPTEGTTPPLTGNSPPYVNQPGIQSFDGTQNVRGRSISPNHVEDIIGNTPPTINPTNGNRSYSSGDVLVVTSSEGRVITIVTGAD